MMTAFWGRARGCSLSGNRESLVCLGHFKRHAVLEETKWEQGP